MKTPEGSLRTPAQIEAAVMAEGREWMRQRLEKELQQLADEPGEVFPHSGRRLIHRHAYDFHLDTAAGVVEICAWHGQDPADQHWGCPLRERWG